MVEILSDYSTSTLTKAIHDSWNTIIHKYFSNYPSTYYKETPQLKILDNKINIPMFNRIYHTNLDPEDAEQKISEIIKHFDSRKLRFTWQVDPGDKPDDLASRLEKAGLERSEGPGMAAMLEKLVEPKTPEDFRYERVETTEKLKEYAYLLCRAYGIPEFGWDTFAGATIKYGMVDDLQHYIGYYDEEPVATSTILYSDGVAGLYNVANLPEVRRKGIGSMISYVPFIDAVDKGYKIGILHSSRIGYNVYKRLGFEEICKLVRYQWNPSE